MWVLVASLTALCGCSFPGTAVPDDDVDAPRDALRDPDAASADAAVDATSVWTVVETMIIDTANSQPTRSMMTLNPGVMYRLRASGTASVIDGIEGDSEYYDFSNPKDNACCEDVGIGIDDPVVDLDTTPDWGPYNVAHVYEIAWPGAGAQISAAYQDTVYGNNSGNLTLEILALQ